MKTKEQALAALEALDRIQLSAESGVGSYADYDIVKKALIALEAMAGRPIEFVVRDYISGENTRAEPDNKELQEFVFIVEVHRYEDGSVQLVEKGVYVCEKTEIIATRLVKIKEGEFCETK